MRTARLNIAVVTETFPPEINGVARTVGVMVDWLLEQGHAVELVRPRQRDEWVYGPRPGLTQRLSFGAGIPGYPNLQLGFATPHRLRTAWRRSRPHLVHIVTEGPLGWAAICAAASLGIPISSDFHTNFHSYSAHYGFGWLENGVAGYLRRLHNRTGCTVVPTPELKLELERLGFERVLIVGRGVDSRLFNPGWRSTELRRQWGCPGDEPVVISVGRLAPEKGLDVFANAARGMQAIDPSIRVVVVGDGPRRAALEKRHPGFHFAGARTGEDLAAHYASADIFLFPSTTETFGNVVLEAMASGLAVVAYDEAAAHQHLVHLESGLLAPSGDVKHFEHLAELLAHEPSLRLALGREARQVAEPLSWDRAFAELEEVLRDVAARGPLTGSAVPLRAGVNRVSQSLE